MKEVEIRGLIDSPVTYIDVLESHGFVLLKEVYQEDIIFDKPDASLFKSGQKIRIRIEDSNAEITYKGLFIGDDKVSRREEVNISIQIGDINNYYRLFEVLGYPFCFKTPKNRMLYSNNNVNIMFDNWPVLGWLVEIEGEEEQIIKTANDFFPCIQFKNFRLKELFKIVSDEKNKTFKELISEYETETSSKLGKIELIIEQ